jgi:hypothetical protein
MWNRFQIGASATFHVVPGTRRSSSSTTPPCQTAWFTVGVALVQPTRHLGALGQVVASAIVVVGTALPWVHSGDRSIDLYEMRRIAHRLEAEVDLRLVDPVVFVPFVLATSLLARWAGFRRTSWCMALAAATYTGLGALLMVRSSLPTGSGVGVAGIGALALVAIVSGEWFGRRLRSVSATAEIAPDVTHPHDADGSERRR